MTLLTIAGSVLIVGGILVCRAASKADNDGAWALYGCLPLGIGVALIALAVIVRAL